MLRLALLAALVSTAAQAAETDTQTLPKAFGSAAFGMWTRIAETVDTRLTPEALLRALATCRQDPQRMVSGTLIMPRGQYAVRADLASRDVVAIAAAKASGKRGRASPWALATDRGYRAVAFVTRGEGKKARHFMLDETGIYLRCGDVPKAFAPKAEPTEETPAG